MAPDAPDRLAPAGAGRTWLGALGVIAVAGGLGWAAGPVGLLAAGLVGVLWYGLPGPYAVAAGHLIALPVVPDPVGLGPLAVLEAGFLTVLAAPAVVHPDWPAALAPYAGAGLVLGAVAWVGWTAWEPRWLAGLAVVGLVAVALYGLHRVQVVRFELREVDRPA